MPTSFCDLLRRYKYMRIGHYAEGLFYPGGISSYVRRVVLGQLARGHEIVLLHPEDADNGIAVRGFSPATIVPSVYGDSLFQEAMALELDVLHAHTLVDLPVAPPARLPALVRTMHGHEAYCPSGTRFLARPTSRPCPRAYHLTGCTWGHFVNRCGSIRPGPFAADFRRLQRERRSAGCFHTIAISEFVQKEMVRCGYDHHRITLLHNPAPSVVSARINLFESDSTDVLLFLGRLIPSKGLPWLLRAAARIEHPFRLQIAGVGPQEAEWRRLTQALGLEDRVEWLGWLDETQVCERIAKSRAVIFPSLWHEPAGLITAEAAACARPVIASDVGGIPEYAGKLGHALLVPPGDVEALAAAMTRLLVNASLAERLGRTGWERLRTGALGLDEHLTGLEAVYRRASRTNGRNALPRPHSQSSMEQR